jgi:hypothetical protein
MEVGDTYATADEVKKANALRAAATHRKHLTFKSGNVTKGTPWW